MRKRRSRREGVRSRRGRSASSCASIERCLPGGPFRARGHAGRLRRGVRYTDPMPLILDGLPPLHWAVAGAGVAAVTLCLLLVANRRLGVSTGFEDVCSLVLRQSYFRRESLLASRTWRMPFVVGLVLGGLLSALAGGGWTPTWELGMFDERIGFGPAGKLAWMFTGGLFIGFGTRLGGGCTSGHGIFGMSNLELPSILTTMSFMAGGIVTTQLLYRLVFA